MEIDEMTTVQSGNGYIFCIALALGEKKIYCWKNICIFSHGQSGISNRFDGRVA